MSQKKASSFPGYTGKWAWIDLSEKKITISRADPEIYRKYIGGRGVQAYLLLLKLKNNGPIRNPFGPENRIILGTAIPNDTFIPTAGRGSCSFISPMTRSLKPYSWIPEHKILYGLITHSSCGGQFPNRLKRAGFDQVIIDGKAPKPVRLFIQDRKVHILEAEDDLFEDIEGKKTLRRTSEVISFLSHKHPDSSTVCPGPAGWNGVEFACLTADFHRNFGRGGGGAVFGSKNLVAVTALGKEKVNYADVQGFKKLSRELDKQVQSAVNDSQNTASFRPETGTTWWLDRAFNGKYLGRKGGYLPWHNFDEGYFSPQDYACVSTASFLEIAKKHNVCNRCRHIFCAREAQVKNPPYSGTGARPEFETIALWINCCILNKEAIFHMNKLANELGIDTMTFGSITAAVMELTEKGFLDKWDSSLTFGNAPRMIDFIKDLAYRREPLGNLMADHTDLVIEKLAAENQGSNIKETAFCATTTFGGLGYAGIEPKVFPGMFTAYATSNRGRGDHTYAWTIQAEEGGLKEADALSAYVVESQYSKALIDSLGLCDFFCADINSELFLSLYKALTGFEYSSEELTECGRRIYTLERYLNNIQGRDNSYDAFIPEKLTVPLTAGPHRGKAVRKAFHLKILDHYYQKQGWSKKGTVEAELLNRLKIT